MLSYLHVTQRNGRRTSSARYLHPALTSAYQQCGWGRSETILFERGRATGVEVAASGGYNVIHAEREVILRAGVVRSPQLLMVSGVGPADALRSLGMTSSPIAPGLATTCRTMSAYPSCTSARARARHRRRALVRGAIGYT